MFENIISFFRKMVGAEQKVEKSKNTAKERLHLVLIQDRASVSADFLDAMKQEIIDVIKKYVEIDESAIDVRLTNNTNEDGTSGAPALYANIPISNVKNVAVKKEDDEENVNINLNFENNKEEKIESKIDNNKETPKMEKVEDIEEKEEDGEITDLEEDNEVLEKRIKKERKKKKIIIPEKN